MLSFEDTMRRGAAVYSDVLTALGLAGLPAQFTQTGGMNAALEVRLDGGHTLLVTDAEDALAWDRDAHRGWAVGLYPPDSACDEGALVFAATEDGSVEALLQLASAVLREAQAMARGPA